jgi:hypothetical protein
MRREAGVRGRRQASHELRGVIAGGTVSALALFATIIGVGRVGSFEALGLIEAALPTAQFFASSVIGGSITILALLLTLVALTLRSDVDFHTRLFVRARYLTRLSVTSLLLATAILLAMTIPIGEVDELGRLYATFYYGLAVVLAVLGGLVVATGLLIGATLRGLLDMAHPEGVSDLETERDDELPSRDEKR